LDDGTEYEALAERSRRLAEQALAQATVMAEAQDAVLPEALDSYPQAHVLDVLDLEAGPLLQLRAARNVTGFDGILALSFRKPTAHSSLRDLDARVFVLREQAGTLSREAHGHVRLPSNICVDNDAGGRGPMRELSIETFGYDLAPVHKAFVVRVTCSISQPSSAGEETHLLLFERLGSRLEQIFMFTQSHTMLDRVSQVDTTEESTLSVSQVQRAGYFALKLHSVTTRTRIPDDEVPERTLDMYTKHQRFEWNGSKYLPVNHR
jgi:hypothetical protein